MNSHRQLFLIGKNCNLVEQLGNMLAVNDQRAYRFDSPEAFLENHSPEPSGCLLYVSCRQPTSQRKLMNGLAQREIRMPVILITRRGEECHPFSDSGSTAKGCPVHHFEQPFAHQDVLQRIRQILDINLNRELRTRQRDAIHARLRRLSSQRCAHSRLQIVGRLSRQIAAQLGNKPTPAEPHPSASAGHFTDTHRKLYRQQLGCPINCSTAGRKMTIESNPVE